jgi:heterodisulfide reductase subunit A-like polyferredoxin
MGSTGPSIVMDRYPPSGISILTIGGGIGGLTFAIEAYRKGHEVRIVEKRPDFNDYGKATDKPILLCPSFVLTSQK